MSRNWRLHALFCAALGLLLLVVAPVRSQEPEKAQVEALFDAIAASDAAAVRALVEADGRLLKVQDARRWNKPTVVTAAMGRKQAAVLEVLLTLGADPNAANGEGETAMHLLRFGDADKVRQLLAAGGRLDATDASGMTLLHALCADRRLHELAQFIIAQGADVNAANAYGLTPLHVGAAQGAADFLLPAGARIDARDWRGRSAMHYAGNAAVAGKLHKAGAPIEQGDHHGWTPLHEAAWMGWSDMVDWLLDQGVNSNVVDDEGWTPLHAAARLNERAIAERLLAAGVDSSTRNAMGQTASELAGRQGHAALAELLQRAAVASVSPSPSPAPAPRPAAGAEEQDRLRPGTPMAERPTLICLGFRWPLEGDVNRNATCAVTYRRAGEQAWRPYHDALRIGGEIAGATGWVNPHQFAGSLLNLEPGVAYEVRLTLSDPDGVDGESECVLSMTTRTEPRAFDGGRTLHVYASDWSSERLSPHFDDVQAAYDAAEPGDVVLVHAGNHQRDLVLNKKATAQKPIVIRGAGDGEAKLQGMSNDIVNVDGSAHTILENLTLYDADHGILARGQTHALTVRGCRFRQVTIGMFAISPSNTDFLIIDNDMQGPVTDWHPREEASQGVWLAGRGHVAAHNRIRKFWDGLSLFGKPSADPQRQNAAIDFYNNDLAEFYDDAIEIDYGMHNIRVMRNAIRNTFMGISTQPLQGGPGYIVRNVMYATTRSPLKLNQKPSGLLIYHNTMVADGVAGSLTEGFQNTRVYNNLFVGKAGEWMIAGGSPTPTTDLDCNAYRRPDGKADGALLVHWRLVQPSPLLPSGSGLSRTLSVGSLDEFARFSQQRYLRHGAWLIDYDAFIHCPPPDVSRDQHDASPIDLQLSPDSVAVDNGRTLAGINNGFHGRGPDLGAYEQGESAPTYGPRR